MADDSLARYLGRGLGALSRQIYSPDRAAAAEAQVAEEEARLRRYAEANRDYLPNLVGDMWGDYYRGYHGEPDIPDPVEAIERSQLEADLIHSRFPVEADPDKWNYPFRLPEGAPLVQGPTLGPIPPEEGLGPIEQPVTPSDSGGVLLPPGGAAGEGISGVGDGKKVDWWGVLNAIGRGLTSSGLSITNPVAGAEYLAQGQASDFRQKYLEETRKLEQEQREEDLANEEAASDLDYARKIQLLKIQAMLDGSESTQNLDELIGTPLKVNQAAASGTILDDPQRNAIATLHYKRVHNLLGSSFPSQEAINKLGNIPPNDVLSYLQTALALGVQDAQTLDSLPAASIIGQLTARRRRAEEYISSSAQQYLQPNSDFDEKPSKIRDRVLGMWSGTEDPLSTRTLITQGRSR